MGKFKLSADESQRLSSGEKVAHSLEFLQPSSQYQVCITLHNATLWGPRSCPLAIDTPKLAAPLAPTAPRIHERGVNEFTVAWDDAHHDYATEYEVQVHETLWKSALRTRTSRSSVIVKGLKAVSGSISESQCDHVGY